MDERGLSLAGIGFTVALFVTAVAIGSGKVPTEFGMLKLVLLSFAAGPLALVLARSLKVERINA